MEMARKICSRLSMLGRNGHRLGRPSDHRQGFPLPSRTVDVLFLGSPLQLLVLDSRLGSRMPRRELVPQLRGW